MRRLLLLVFLFAIIFFTMLLGLSFICFVNTVEYDGGVRFSYSYSAFVYAVKASLGGALPTSLGLWLYIFFLGKK